MTGNINIRVLKNGSVTDSNNLSETDPDPSILLSGSGSQLSPVVVNDGLDGGDTPVR